MVPNTRAAVGIEYASSISQNIVSLVISGTLAIVDEGSALAVVDVSDPNHPVRRSFIGHPGRSFHLARSGNYVFMPTLHSGLLMFDVSDPEQPVMRGSYPTPEAGRLIASDPDSNFIVLQTGDLNEHLLILDVSKPTEPVLLGSYDYQGSAVDLKIADNYAYLALRRGQVDIIDLHDLAHPAKLGRYSQDNGIINAIDVANNYAYLALESGWGGYGLKIIDVSNPGQPVLVGELAEASPDGEPEDISDVAVDGSFAYVQSYVPLNPKMGNRQLKVIDVHDVTQPRLVGRYNYRDFHLNVEVNDHIVYSYSQLARNLLLIDVTTPSTPTLRGTYGHGEFFPTSYFQFFDNYLYTLTVYYNEYELRIFDISNPARPVVLGTYRQPGRASDFKVVARHAYIVSTGDLYIINIEEPRQPMLVGQLIREGNERPFGTVEVNGNIAYLGLYPSVQLDNDSIFIVNVTDPIHPEGIATYKLPNVENIGLGVTLDIQSKNSTLYVLTTMYLLTIDTRNPSNPTLLSSYKIPGERIEAESIHIQQDLAFITIRNNSTWKYSIIALNIKDRLHPQIVDIYQYQSGVRVTTFGRFAFIVSNDSLQSSNTIEIFDIIDPANPIKIATYDLGYFYSGAAIHKNLLFTGRDIYHITGLPKAYLPLVQH